MIVIMVVFVIRLMNMSVEHGMLVQWPVIAMLEGLTGIRYDAVDKILYIDSRIGDDFTSFLSTETGFGNVGLKEGKPFIDVKYGVIDVQKCIVSGKEIQL